MELNDELVRDNLTRKQLAERHGITSDRVTQWLCLLKLPEEKLKEVEALGDNWDTRLITERELRRYDPLDEKARKKLLLKNQIRFVKPLC